MGGLLQGGFPTPCFKCRESPLIATCRTPNAKSKGVLFSIVGFPSPPIEQRIKPKKIFGHRQNVIRSFDGEIRLRQTSQSFKPTSRLGRVLAYAEICVCHNRMTTNF